MKEIEIKTQSEISKIIIEKNLKDRIFDFLEDKRYFVITNKTIAKIYRDFLKNFENVIVISDGEKYKNIKTYEFITNELLKRKIERKDSIIALGGGVVGDLAGFCASSVLRGVELIQVPTTLLAMCDSSIGGKTGFNTKYGKNLLGSFYLANKVLVDSSFLETLPEREFKCGMGEIVKYAFIEKSCKCDEDFDLINHLDDISYIINACITLKARVVELDKKEGGLRKILNFGHTFAHGFETVLNYKGLTHGEAVALGIKCAAKLAYRSQYIDFDYFSKINTILDKYDLTSQNLHFSKNKVYSIMKHDKKVENGKINLLLPTRPQEVELFDNIEEPSVLACLP